MPFTYAEVVRLPFHLKIFVFVCGDFNLGCEFELLNEKTLFVVT